MRRKNIMKGDFIMVKIKKIITMALMFCMLTGIVYGADLVMTNQDGYYEGAYKKVKKLRDNSAKITITSGPITGRDTVYFYLDWPDHKNNKTSYASQVLTVTSPITNVKTYYNPFDYTTFCEHEYAAYAWIQRYSYSNTMTLKGDFTP